MQSNYRILAFSLINGTCIYYGVKLLIVDCIYLASRNCFFKKIWNCCETLFTLGPLERRDAYSVLSLYTSFYSCTEGPENPDGGVRVEGFDISAERAFWDELKRGLVISFSLFSISHLSLFC